ncbi:uncharacterized protein CIMG_13678 [Coccidioides immitis RS]|uniref:Uncharacterized protein n=1 Tax=Coccidioides immitis (strain RS) TaxID=246410 RepID=J3KAJ9_COCIM|nr:uncharacterized protein CIMG_13678 [Coccidioides immitis RS]EAS32051.3 hypothetical protein CIMG_13678 [Coccidioides immitis RS]
MRPILFDPSSLPCGELPRLSLTRYIRPGQFEQACCAKSDLRNERRSSKVGLEGRLFKEL